MNNDYYNIPSAGGVVVMAWVIVCIHGYHAAVPISDQPMLLLLMM